LFIFGVFWTLPIINAIFCSLAQLVLLDKVSAVFCSTTGRFFTQELNTNIIAKKIEIIIINRIKLGNTVANCPP
jgi:hypothetical protein